MELEEEMLSLSGRNSELELKVNQLEENLNRQETACRESQRELNQQVVELERELKRVTELKEELEKDLGEAQGGAR
jgi:chromosome segregation ATPase